MIKPADGKRHRQTYIQIYTMFLIVVFAKISILFILRIMDLKKQTNNKKHS